LRREARLVAVTLADQAGALLLPRLEQGGCGGAQDHQIDTGREDRPREERPVI
jgi:hypothetical protein